MPMPSKSKNLDIQVESPPPSGAAEHMYEVQADFEVPRGASSFLLRKGKVISSRGYDVEGLQKLGVQLVAKSAPAA